MVMEDESRILHRYMIGEADEKDRAAIASWIQQSDSNKRQFIRLRRIYLNKRVAELSSLEMVEKAEKELMKRIEGRRQQDRREKLRLMVISVVSVAAILFGFVYIRSIQNTAVQSSHIIQSKNIKLRELVTVSTKNQLKTVVLPDGTRAWLNKHSSLSYYARNNDSIRKVTLEGEAYFDVVKSKHRPFIVSVGRTSIRVLGTRFNVRQNKLHGKIEAVLLSGKIELLDGHMRELAVLHPNSLAVVDKAGVVVQEDINAGDYIAWIKGVQVFQNQTIADIAVRIKERFDVKVILSGHLDPGRSYRCVFSEKQKLKDVAGMLEYIAPVQCSISNDTLYIFNH